MIDARKDKTHVLIVDYDHDRRSQVVASFAGQTQVVLHLADSRSTALGLLWEMALHGVFPRAVVAAWLMNEPSARDFYRLIGREVDHTSLGLFRNATIIDKANTERTVLICYTDTDDEAVECLYELQGEGLDHVVGVFNRGSDQSFADLPVLLHGATAGAIQAITDETVRDLDEGDDDGSHDSSGTRLAAKRLSR